MQSKPPSQEFNDILLQSIDDTLTALLSRSVTDALYTHLQTTHAISRAEVPYKLDTLSHVLEQTFGAPSSRTISRAIARKFYTALQLKLPDNSSRSLVEYVDGAKTSLQQRKPQSNREGEGK